jgi:6-phosphogluconate dehydrogenase (decarboxylating)
MSQADFGVIGLGTMGRNLALNIESRGFSVAVWNLETEWVADFLAQHPGQRFVGTSTLQDLVAAVAPPRRILMMIPAGAPVDATIGTLRPLVARGDVLIDGGNSWFEDTARREASLAADGIHFMGCGVSGGEEGARHGPSLMPGGPGEAWTLTRNVLEAIAATTEAGPCVTYVGPGGAGHFVKMVHNGIEYADMQLIAETWDLLRRGLTLGAAEAADVFDRWNRGPLESFLLELTARVGRVIDRTTGEPLVDAILDRAGQKGTGRWTAQVALDLGIPIPTIAAAIDARVLSSMKAERVAAGRVLGGPQPADVFANASRPDAIEDLHSALYAARICSYAQGMALIGAGSAAHAWGVTLAEIGRIWKNGCIIRARLLDPVRRAFEQAPALPNLLLDPAIGDVVEAAQAGWRRTIASAAAAGIPFHAHASALAYFDSYRSPRLPQNLTQAQRDAFGAHKYERTDNPGVQVHSEW